MGYSAREDVIGRDSVLGEPLSSEESSDRSSKRLTCGDMDDLE